MSLNERFNFGLALVREAGDLALGYFNSRDKLTIHNKGPQATLNGQPITGHTGKSVKDGLTVTGYSPKCGPDEFLPAFERFLKAGGMFYRDGSGALGLCYVAAGRVIGFFEPLIKSWDCLGAVAVIHAAGLKTNDFLANDGLHKGNPIIAGNEHVYAEIEAIIAGSY